MATCCRASGIEGGPVGWQPLPTLDAFEKLRWAWRRTIETCPTQEHPYFGVLTHEEWIKLQLRHSELHQGFMHPGG